VTIVPGPQIVIKPEVACCISEYKKVFTDPEKVKIKKNSSLVLKGPGKLTIESIDLDGALVVDTQEAGTGVIRDLVVKNKGWTLESEDNVDASNVSSRGYVLKKKDTSDIVFKDPRICAIM
jgi:UDP-sugar pyrophosphorylase